MANPDGYEYSRDHVSCFHEKKNSFDFYKLIFFFLKDRYWRKNRAINSGSSCKGVDMNRNWGFHWAG